MAAGAKISDNSDEYLIKIRVSSFRGHLIQHTLDKHSVQQLWQELHSAQRRGDSALQSWIHSNKSHFKTSDDRSDVVLTTAKDDDAVDALHACVDFNGTWKNNARWNDGFSRERTWEADYCLSSTVDRGILRHQKCLKCSQITLTRSPCRTKENNPRHWI